MKTLTLSKTNISLLGSVAAALSLLTAGAFAGPDRFIDDARVTNVTPVYTTVTREVPQRECWVEEVREDIPHRHRSATPAIVGGIVGGAIGNAMGAGSDNKKVGAVVGSLLGMSVGSDMAKHHGRYRDRPSEVIYRDVERCEVRHRVESEQRLVGYDVDYRYRGQHYSTRMDHDPGKRIRVSVNIKPLHR